MNSSEKIGRSHSRKHYHEQSMDDFMKNIKKYNLRSERYTSPKPQLYMYGRNNTINGMDKSRSRTLSNHKSPNSKSKKSKKDKDRKSSTKITKTKLEKIFKYKNDESKNENQNPAIFIENCGNKLKKAEKYLDGKSSIGTYLCKEFLCILNEMVEKMVFKLDEQLKEIEFKTSKQIQNRYEKKIQNLESKNQKMAILIQTIQEKLSNNTKLLYQIRLLHELDVDFLFGKAVMGTDQCGGLGYSKNVNEGSEMDENEESLRYFNEESEGIIELKRLERDEKHKERSLRNEVESEEEIAGREFKDNFKMDDREQKIEDIRSPGLIRQAYVWEREAHGVYEKGDKKVNEFLIAENFESMKLKGNRKSR